MSSPRSVVVFGGARGIGAAVARRFAAAGDRVLVGDVLADEGERLAAGSDGAIRFLNCDVADAAQIQALYDQALVHSRGIDVVFNNVGIARYGTVDVLSLEDWDLTLRVNLTAQFLSCKRAVAEMKAQGRGGVIVNNASILAYGSQKTTAAYAASKAGVQALTRSIAIDHAADGVRCVSISPGTIDTPLVQIAAATFKDRNPEDLRREWAAHHPLNRLGLPEEVAETVFFLASPGAGFITGSDILIDGGIRAELYG